MLSDRYTTGEPSDRYHTEPVRLTLREDAPTRAEADRDERESAPVRGTSSLPVSAEDFAPGADRRDW